MKGKKPVFILCKCGHEMQVSDSTDIEWTICEKCARIGCFTVQPF